MTIIIWATKQTQTKNLATTKGALLAITKQRATADPPQKSDVLWVRDNSDQRESTYQIFPIQYQRLNIKP
jgi:hypothetical protein